MFKKSAALFFALLVLSGCGTASPASAPVSAQPPMVSLTFDDGPHSIYTDRILNTLADNDAKGTFFILGSRINEHIPQLSRIIDEGCEIGNHTWGHLDMTLLDSASAKRQIMSVYNSINGIFSAKPVLLRPPYGFCAGYAGLQQDFPIICWSVDTLDWARTDPVQIADEVLSSVRDGDIILMHDIYPSTAEAVEIIVPALVSKGFELVTVSELFEKKGIPLGGGKVYYSAS